jgi:hypothetical protein
VLRGGRRKQVAGEKGGSVKVCSIARFVREKEKKRESTRPGAERRAAPVCPTGRCGGRSGRLPDVEKRGAASAGDAGGGRRSRATRGARGRGRRAAGGAQDRAGAAACSRGGNREKPGIGEDEEDPVVKSRKLRGLTVKLG